MTVIDSQVYPTKELSIHLLDFNLFIQCCIGIFHNTGLASGFRIRCACNRWFKNNNLSYIMTDNNSIYQWIYI